MKNFSIFLFVFILHQSVYAQTLPLPPRSTSAYNGTQIVALLTPLSQTIREDSIFSQVISGNVPDFMRTLVEVRDTATIGGNQTIVQYYVTPDYLALGCDTDYFLCPMTPLLAQRLADYMGFTLPTRQMVNHIYFQSTVKLAPQPIAPSPQMITVPVFATHDSMVWAQRQPLIATHPLGELVGGDKKDVIISNQIYGHPAPGRVVIYGWHQLSGSPIQPLYYGHEETYADYSHGIRMVQKEMLVNGNMMTVQQILTSSVYNTLLSDEGAIAVPRYPVTAPAVSTPLSFCLLHNSATSFDMKVKPKTHIKGHRVSVSTDNGQHFGLPEYYDGNFFTVSGLTADTNYFVKIAEVCDTGGVSEYTEVLGIHTGGIYPVLVVNGFDRATSGNTYDFTRQHGLSIVHNGYSFYSATNDAVKDSLLFLAGTAVAVDYILGEESSVNETFDDEEQAIITDFMNNGGKLFVSGSEIGWDLDHLGSATDKAFYNNVLEATYVADAPNNLSSTYYEASETSYFVNPADTIDYDNGTHGTYDVRYPDVITPSGTGLWGTLEYTTVPGAIAGFYQFPYLVYFAFPFETIYDESIRNRTMLHVLNCFDFYTNKGATVKTDFQLSLHPNPAGDYVNLVLKNITEDVFTVSVYNLMGELQFSESFHSGFQKKMIHSVDLKSMPAGMYVISVFNGKSSVTQKLVKQ